MSLNVSKSELKKRFTECQKNQSETQGHPISKCEECDIYNECCDYGSDIRKEAIESTREANGRFGKLYLEE